MRVAAHIFTRLCLRLILLRPKRVAEQLQRVEHSGVTLKAPTVWQIAVGVLRMWHRMLTRPDTVGISSTPRRSGLRARLFAPRWLRFPFLLWEGSVIPLDLSGLRSSPETLIRHVLGTHHDGEQFIYDLQILSCYAGALLELQRRLYEVVHHDTRRSRWLRDLCVYEGYHEAVLQRLNTIIETAPRTERGHIRVRALDSNSPDICFYAYLEWCSRQPQTPRATYRAWREGALVFDETVPSTTLDEASS